MRPPCLLLIILLSPASILASDRANPTPVTNIYVLRTAEQLQSPHILTYRVFEWTQERGRLIAPDFGYYDTGYGKDQIWFMGAGAEMVRSRHFDWDQELYISQEAGPQANNRRALWIWPVLNFRFPSHFAAQVAAYPTLPLDRAQRVGYDVDRAKVEKSIGTRWLVGAGFAGGICTARTWQNQPFLTVTRKTHAGNFEFWLQKISGGSQVQFRYALIKGDN